MNKTIINITKKLHSKRTLICNILLSYFYLVNYNNPDTNTLI